ncbi:MAG: flagellar assembly protein FliW [Clostridia bacterium]|nr:flagellar assembly protein FliW [Clostridia bacterium]
MKLQTKYFGEMDYEKEEVISFPDGLFGFEDEKEFLLIRFDNENDALLSLQSVNTPSLAFITVNPFRFVTGYEPDIPEEDVEFLGVSAPEQVGLYAIAVVGSEVKDTTVNLRAPLVINVETRKGRQVLLETAEYSFRQVIMSAEQAKEAGK